MIEEIELKYTASNLVKLIRDNHGDNGIEYLVSRLISVIGEDQLRVLIDYEERNG